MTTTASASKNDLPFNDKEHEIGPTIRTYHERQHGRVMIVDMFAVKHKNPDIDMLAQAVVAMRDQLLDEQRRLRAQDNKEGPEPQPSRY